METKEKEFSRPHKFSNVSIRRHAVCFGFVKTMFTFRSAKSRNLLFSENDCHLKFVTFLLHLISLRTMVKVLDVQITRLLEGARYRCFCNECMSCFCCCVTCFLIARVIFPPRIARLQLMCIISCHYCIIYLFA